MSKVLCTFGVVLVCLHTFVLVRTSPMGRRHSRSSLQRSLQKNITTLAKLFNLTKFYSSKASLPVKRTNMDLSLPNAPATNSRKLKLHSRYGFFLRMSKGGYVDGTSNKFSPDVVFELQSVKSGIFRIQHSTSKRYLGMDKHGVLRGRLHSSVETLFEESTSTRHGYNLYASYKYTTWYLAIRKWSGTQKPGRYTTAHQKAVQFLLED